MSGTLTRIGSIEVHPAANLFPEMPDDKLSELAERIRDHGVLVPLVFLDGKMIDGRNRVRASLIAGLNTDRLPRRNLPPETDPYQWAWDANCSRLDYTPAQKAAVRIKVDEASGELARLRAEVAERANRARAEKQVGVPKAEAKERPVSRDTGRSATPTRERERIAEAAHVSPATVARVQKIKREDPEAFEALATKGKLPPGHPLNAKRKQAKNWSVPRSIPALASFLRERLTSHERRDLARLLMEGDEAAA